MADEGHGHSEAKSKNGLTLVQSIIENNAKVLVWFFMATTLLFATLWLSTETRPQEYRYKDGQTIVLSTVWDQNFGYRRPECEQVGKPTCPTPVVVDAAKQATIVVAAAKSTATAEALLDAAATKAYIAKFGTDTPTPKPTSTPRQPTDTPVPSPTSTPRPTNTPTVSAAAQATRAAINDANAIAEAENQADLLRIQHEYEKSMTTFVNWLIIFAVLGVIGLIGFVTWGHGKHLLDEIFHALRFVSPWIASGFIVYPAYLALDRTGIFKVEGLYVVILVGVMGAVVKLIRVISGGGGHGHP